MGMLSGKVAIITGAGHGVGREEALAMAKEGCNLIIMISEPEPLI